MNDKISQKKIEAAQSIISAEEVIKKRRNNFDLTLNLLRTDRDRLTLDQVALETQLGRNKKCIDSCHRMQSNKIISLSAAVDRCIKYLNKEISDIEELLETLVGDVCVAAVVFVRSAWLSESIRMACMDAFRQHLRMQVLTKLFCLFFHHHVSLLLSSRASPSFMCLLLYLLPYPSYSPTYLFNPVKIWRGLITYTRQLQGCRVSRKIRGIGEEIEQ